MSVRKLCAAAARAVCVWGLVVLVIVPSGSSAQTTGTPVTSNPQIQGILNAISGQSAPAAPATSQVPPTAVMPSQSTLPQTVPPVAPIAPQPPSHLEQLFSQRAGRQLTQYGYDT